MRIQQTPQSLTQLIAVILLAAPRAIANPNPHPSEQAGFSFNELFERYDCAGTYCGYYSQLCCTAGQSCATNNLNQATCTAAGVTVAAGASSGYWQYYTTTYVETDLRTITATVSSYVGGGAATSTATAICNYALSQKPCGPICCASDQFCYVLGQCAPGGGDSSGLSGAYTAPMTGTATNTPGAPLRGTSSGVITATTTAAQTTTVPFIPPVATGANITVTGMETTNNGLSGGAIAGIVIGVLVGLLILGIILTCCCCVGLIDGVLALFGLGKKKRRTEVEEYERFSHHSTGGPRRTWYGAPVRTSRTEKKKSEGRNILAILGGLGALWVLLGLKRKHDAKERREHEAISEYSYSDYTYTSASSESSDRRTRDDRRERSASRRRSMSRR